MKRSGGPVRLVVFVAMAVSGTLFYGYGDAFLSLGLGPEPGNLDVILVPLLGKLGYYAFEVLLPLAQIMFVCLAVREAWLLGKAEGMDEEARGKSMS